MASLNSQFNQEKNKKQNAFYLLVLLILLTQYYWILGQKMLPKNSINNFQKLLFDDEIFLCASIN